MQAVRLSRIISGRRLALLALGLAALAGAGAYGLWPQEEELVRIGVGQPLSGPLAPMGKDILQGAQLAAEQLNREGGIRIDGKRKRIEIVAADDHAEAALGVAAAQTLVDRRVLAAIAHLNSGVSMAAAPVYAKAGVAQLSISTKPQYTELGLPTTLRLVANDDMQALALAQFASDTLKARRIATLHDGTPYGQGLMEGVRRALQRRGDTRVVADLGSDDKTTDFKPLLHRLEQSRPDLLITSGADFQVEALIQQLDAAGLADLTILGSDNMKTPRLQALALGSRRVFASTPIVSAAEFLGGEDFLREFRQRFGNEPYYAAHYAYDAVHVVADALNHNASLDRGKLLARLKQFEGNAPVTRLMRFGEHGEQRSGAVGVYSLERGKWHLAVRSSRW